MAIVFCIIILLPFLQKVFRIFPKNTLHGAEAVTAKPTWSIHNWFDGSAQKDFEHYFGQKVGFRGWVVKGVNQFNFSVFHRITGNLGTPVLLGKDNWLYEKSYVTHRLRPVRMHGVDREDFAEKLRRLQHALAP